MEAVGESAPSNSTRAEGSPRVDDTLPQFQFKKWNAVALWKWKFEGAEHCAICRNSTSEPSIEYQANPISANENGLSVTFGVCNHVFHLDCIQRWHKTRNICPTCSAEWNYLKTERIPGNFS